MTQGMAGMMWQDHSKRPLEARIADAISYYERKYGMRPTWVQVPVGDLVEDLDLYGCRVGSRRYILPGHLWLGVERVAGELARRSGALLDQAEGEL